MTVFVEQQSPTITLSPAPWNLQGYSRTLLCKLPMSMDAKKQFVPKQFGSTGAGYAIVMFVSYKQSNIGPYDELLFLPLKKFDLSTAHQVKEFTITRIFVSSEASVEGGRKLWGTPKQLARFKVIDLSSGGKEVSLYRPNQNSPFVRFRFHDYGPSLPFNSKVIPFFLRRIGQCRDGKTFRFLPSAKGTQKFTRFSDFEINPEEFPDLNTVKIIGGLAHDHLHLKVPKAETW